MGTVRRERPRKGKTIAASGLKLKHEAPLGLMLPGRGRWGPRQGRPQAGPGGYPPQLQAEKPACSSPRVTH